ncbi:hypothetical protein IVA79_18560 [Bradyrhizobium sp. 138]|uniref:S8 family serine peptidase n=1 Tax=Bradyrhizobium sp. 138 TaxID=2782615 RepID=UPI001FF9DD49|nr:S8 family serine peptidase [Bradyrhizobium sp. 138]MCK1735888.1 hypothetical protein [Bradyrhizobium sp. 138]
MIYRLPDGLGPYDVWNFGSGRAYAPSSARLASRRYLTAIAALQDYPGGAESKFPRRAGRSSNRVWLPTLWKPGKRGEGGKSLGLMFLPFVVSKPARQAKSDEHPEALRKRLFAGLRQGRIRRYLASENIAGTRFRAGLPVTDRAMKPELPGEPTAPAWRPDAQLRARIGQQKRITVIAVIDDGIPFAHRNFRDASGKHTRVEFCWLQSALPDRQQTSVLFGREYTRAQIEGYIASHGDDEDELYDAAGSVEDTESLASMLRRHTTHGAHVMDLATGYRPERDAAPAEEIRIIAVQLPNLLTMDTSGIGKDMYLLSALHYIFNRAEMIAEGYAIDRARLVVNFSYGYFGGPHDGRFDIEEAISELVKKRRETVGPTALVLPAGNSFLDRLHASIADSEFTRGEVRLPWRLQPNDRTPNYVEIWFPENFNPTGYKVELLDPMGVKRGRIAFLRAGLAKVISLVDEDGRAIGQMSVDEHRRGLRWRVLIATAPSEPECPDSPAVQSGLWTIAIKRERKAPKLAKESIRCWIQRDTDPASLRSGARQSYFDDGDNALYGVLGAPLEVDTYSALVRRFGSLNGLATSKEAIAVAGYRLASGSSFSLENSAPAAYSCAGIQKSGWPEARVTCSSMSDRSKVLPGTVAAGVRSGTRSVMQGTSMAAPFVARQLAMTFVSASDEDVLAAERENYRSLLHGQEQRHRSLKKDRLGEVLVPPHWQPSIEIQD